MVTCSHCQKELDRKVYCSASCKAKAWKEAHKVKVTNSYQEQNPVKTVTNSYHSKLKVTNSYPKEVTNRYPTVTNSYQLEEVQKSKNITTCKHGSMVGLCKYGC